MLLLLFPGPSPALLCPAPSSLALTSPFSLFLTRRRILYRCLLVMQSVSIADSNLALSRARAASSPADPA